MVKKLISLGLMLTFSGNGFSVCMTEEDAYLHSCILNSNQAKTQVCQEYGSEYKAYYESNECSEELAAEYLGIELAKTPINIIEAACFSFEQGEKLGCQEWNYDPAYNFCNQNYGSEFRAYIPSRTCSIAKADELYGYKNPEVLNEGLEVKLAEAEAIMTMIDREGLQNSLAGFISTRPILGKVFYTPVIKGLISKLEIIRSEIEARSKLRVKIESEPIKEFLFSAIRYIRLVGRLNKLYAYSAHKNDIVLGSFHFSELSYLNMKIKKFYGLEILSNISLKVKNLPEDMIEFTQSEQMLQQYEYEAIDEPDTKRDYAKLVSFLGLRENLTNLWAVDKMFDEDLLAEKINRCGPFLSLRSEKTHKAIKDFPLIAENLDYDLFYNKYLPETIELLKVKSQEESLLNITTAKVFYKDIMQRFSPMQQIHSAWDGNQLENIIDESADILVINEDEVWKSFSEYHLKTVVLPGDDIRNPNVIAELLAKTSYQKRRESIELAMVSLNDTMSDDEKYLFRNMINSTLDKNYKAEFVARLKRKIKNEVLVHYSRIQKREEYFEKKIQEALKVVKSSIKSAKFMVEYKRNHKTLPTYLPTNFEELTMLFEHKISTDFQDIKLALDENETLANILAVFFNKISEKFNSEFLVETAPNQFEYKGTDEQRAQRLYDIFFQVAREYYRENNFEITEMAQVPEAVLLAREQEREAMSRNPYTVQVYRDGTPVTVHINDFYAAFQTPLDIEIPRRDILMRVSTLDLMGVQQRIERENNSFTTDGTFGRPRSYISSRGEIRYQNLSPEIGFDALKRLYLQSLDLTKAEIKTTSVMNKENERLMQEAQEDLYDGLDGEYDGKEHFLDFSFFGNEVKIFESENEFEITESRKLFARVFELFKIPMGSIANNYNQHFTLDREDQKVLADSKVNNVYSMQPILRNEVLSNERFGREVINRRRVTNRDVARPVLLKIAHFAYDKRTNQLDEVKASELIIDTYTQAKENIRGLIPKFCQANYMNYQNSESFKEIFRASTYLRQTLMSPNGTTPFNAKRIREFDHAVTEETRTENEKRSDFLEPLLLKLGLVAIVALGVVISIGSLGTAAPASLAAIGGYLSLFMSIEFYFSFALVVGFSYSRINTQFYEVPAQLKFQESIAHSQVGFGKVADYDLIEKKRSENKTAKLFTIGLMPLDLFYGHMVVRQLKANLGHTAVNAAKRLSGVEFRKYTAPPASVRASTNMRELRAELGTIKGTMRGIRNGVSNLRAILPKYQLVPEEFIRTKMLRVAIGNKFKNLGIANNPSAILGELRQYTGKLKERIVNYNQYLLKQKEILDQVRLSNNFSMREVMEHGVQYSKYGYTLRSFGRAIKQGRIFEYASVRGEMLEELNKLQGSLMSQKVEKLESLIDKVMDFKQTKNVGDNIDTLLARLTDDEVLALESIAKDKLFLFEVFTGRQDGYLRELRDVFKDYQTVTAGLRSTTYLYGHVGDEFKETQIEAMNFLHNDTRGQYIFNSDSEDIVLFYESMIRQNAFSDEASKVLRRDIEERISHLYSLDSAGNRIYY